MCYVHFLIIVVVTFFTYSKNKKPEVRTIKFWTKHNSKLNFFLVARSENYQKVLFFQSNLVCVTNFVLNQPPLMQVK